MSQLDPIRLELDSEKIFIQNSTRIVNSPANSTNQISTQ